MTRRFAWVPLCFLAVLFGCMPEYSLRLSNNAAGSSVRGGGGREVIVFASNDARPVRDLCGTLWGSDGRAALRCGSDAEAWLSATIVEGLYRAGFSVVTLETASTPAPLRVRATLHRLIVGERAEAFDWHVIAQVHLSLEAHTANGLRAERTFVLEGYRRVKGFSRGSYYQEAMDRVSLGVAEVVATAMIELAERYPELGREHGMAAQATQGAEPDKVSP